MEQMIDETELQTELARLREITRKRREIEQAIQDAAEDVANQRERITTLLTRILDVTDESAGQSLAAEREQLKRLTVEHEGAVAALRKFNEENPTAAELADREYAEGLKEAQQEQQNVREIFKNNVRRRVQILCELQVLEREAVSLFQSAEERWRHSVPGPRLGVPGLAAAAGIPANLLNFLPKNFWSWNGLPGAPGGRFREIKTAVERWALDLVPEGQ